MCWLNSNSLIETINNKFHRIKYHSIASPYLLSPFNASPLFAKANEYLELMSNASLKLRGNCKLEIKIILPFYCI